MHHKIDTACQQRIEENEFLPDFQQVKAMHVFAHQKRNKQSHKNQHDINHADFKSAEPFRPPPPLKKKRQKYARKRKNKHQNNPYICNCLHPLCRSVFINLFRGEHDYNHCNIDRCAGDQPRALPPVRMIPGFFNKARWVLLLHVHHLLLFVLSIAAS